MAMSSWMAAKSPPFHLHHLQHRSKTLPQLKNPFFVFSSSLSPIIQESTSSLNNGASASTLLYCYHYQASAFPQRRSSYTINALNSDAPHPFNQGSLSSEANKSYEQWDSFTAKFAAASNIPFLLLQMPQIILNAQNLLAGNKTALWAVPWLSMLTCLLGNLSLLSYFAKKRENEAMVVQTLGVVSTFVVIAQLTMAEALPLPYFLVISTVVSSGLVLNFTNYLGLLNAGIWQFWEDFILVGGLSALPQIMWSTFVPYIPATILPGATAFVIAVLAVIMTRSGKLSERSVKIVRGVSGWTATLLFMWMPVSQVWTNFLNPDNIKGLSAYSMLLAMIGNGLLIPRALFIRDFMWFIGSAWGSLFYGYGNIACLYIFKIISKEFFLAATVGLVSWIGMAFWRDALVRGYSSPFTSMNDLVFGMDGKTKS